MKKQAEQEEKAEHERALHESQEMEWSIGEEDEEQTGVEVEEVKELPREEGEEKVEPEEYKEDYNNLEGSRNKVCLGNNTWTNAAVRGMKTAKAVNKKVVLTLYQSTSDKEKRVSTAITSVPVSKKTTRSAGRRK